MANLTITEFLTARYDDEERTERDRLVAQSDDKQRADVWSRVLADIAAKRRILELHCVEVTEVDLMPFDPFTGDPQPAEYEVTCQVCGYASSNPTSACSTVRHLASPFSDHPDYREEWKP